MSQMDGKQPNTQKEIMSFLFHNAGQSYNAEELAQHLGFTNRQCQNAGYNLSRKENGIVSKKVVSGIAEYFIAREAAEDYKFDVPPPTKHKPNKVNVKKQTTKKKGAHRKGNGKHFPKKETQVTFDNPEKMTIFEGDEGNLLQTLQRANATSPVHPAFLLGKTQPTPTASDLVAGFMKLEAERDFYRGILIDIAHILSRAKIVEG